jgi:glucose-6-phosphate 1-dehydrogenase
MPDETLIPQPTVFTLFGATGDLAHRLVIPALYHLACAGLLPSDWRLVGNGRGDVSHEDFQERVRKSLEEFGPHPSEGPWEEFRSRLRFAGGGFDTSDPGSLLDVLDEATSEMGVERASDAVRRVHYLAVPPSAFAPLTEALGQHGLAEGARIVYEKPFGTSMRSFEELDEVAHRVFAEEDIFRIDHFLGKEATQSIHTLRFGNGLFSSSWDRDHIESVQIDVPETLDVGMRAGFYDSTGAILDMLVTHLFQLAAEVAMEPPHSLDAGHISTARQRIIGCFRPLGPGDVVLGQYEGYRDTDGVAPGSRTETFVAARMWVDDPRWEGVPFLLRTGKCMAASHQRVSIRFREPARRPPGLPTGHNVLGFELSGEGEVDLSLVAKAPGPTSSGSGPAAATARLPLGTAFHTPTLPAYSRLIHDVLMGDRSLFTRPDGLRHVWEVADSLLVSRPEPHCYERGTWGPAEAAALAGDPGRGGGWVLGAA